MELFLTLVSGICWCIVYEECIRLSIKHKTYAMPFWALALNITWEGIYAVCDLKVSIGIQPIVNLLWFLLDIVILYFYFKYGKEEEKTDKNARSFYTWSVLGLFAMFAVQIAFIAEFGLADHLSAQYSAFIQNLIMSIAFCRRWNRSAAWTHPGSTCPGREQEREIVPARFIQESSSYMIKNLRGMFPVQ